MTGPGEGELSGDSMPALVSSSDSDSSDNYSYEWISRKGQENAKSSEYSEDMHFAHDFETFEKLVKAMDLAHAAEEKKKADIMFTCFRKWLDLVEKKFKRVLESMPDTADTADCELNVNAAMDLAAAHRLEVQMQIAREMEASKFKPNTDEEAQEACD